MNRAMNMLGLCARAGRLVTGEKAVVQLVRGKGAYLVLLDGAASNNAVKAVSQACDTYSTPLVRTSPDELGDAVGKPGRMAVAITDERMAARVRELFENDENNP